MKPKKKPTPRKSIKLKRKKITRKIGEKRKYREQKLRSLNRSKLKLTTHSLMKSCVEQSLSSKKSLS